MVKSSQPPVDWRHLAEAVPIGVGIQRGESLSYVSGTFAGVVGRDRAELAGDSWRTLFESAEVGRIADALETARTDGRWRGATWMVGAGRVPVELTLSTPAENGTVVWSVDERPAESGDRSDDGGMVELPTGTTAQLARTVLSTVDDVVYIIDDDGTLCFWNEELAATTGYSYREMAEMHAYEFIPPDQHEYVPGLMEAIESIEDRRVEVDILTSDGERITHEFSGTTFEDPESGRAFRCGVARDITEQKERERNLERQRDELAALNRITDLLFETAKESIRTGQGDVAVQVLCERIAASEFYQFAWLGQSEPGEQHVRHSTSSGIERGPARIETSRSSDESAPVAQAMETGTVVVGSATPRWHEDTQGVESITAVPLQHRESIHGVLVLGSGQQEVMTPRERTGLEVLGRLVGVVLDAERTRRLLFSDAVVELDFDMTGVETPYGALAAEFGCTVSLDGYVPSGEGWALYLSVGGASPAAVADQLAEESRVERVRPITDDERSGRLEMVVNRSSLLERVTAVGAAVKVATAEPDYGHLTVEAPVDADVQGIAERIAEVYPAASLLASRERDRKISSGGQPVGVLDGVTDRQREVLEAAYRSGYFEWPRESTGEEVAEALGLTSATVQGHLRKAERAVFSALLESE